MKLPYKYDGLDDAIVGIGQTNYSDQLVVYSYEKIIEVLVRQGMEQEEAIDYADFNIIGMHIGEGQPVILFERTPDETLDYFEAIKIQPIDR